MQRSPTCAVQVARRTASVDARDENYGCPQSRIKCCPTEEPPAKQGRTWGTGWTGEPVRVHDLVPVCAEKLVEHIAPTDWPRTVLAASTDHNAIRDSPRLIVATIARAPHVHNPGPLSHAPRVLHDPFAISRQEVCSRPTTPSMTSTTASAPRLHPCLTELLARYRCFCWDTDRSPRWVRLRLARQRAGILCRSACRPGSRRRPPWFG
jgi:hypothetical protein